MTVSISSMVLFSKFSLDDRPQFGLEMRTSLPWIASWFAEKDTLEEKIPANAKAPSMTSVNTISGMV